MIRHVELELHIENDLVQLMDIVRAPIGMSDSATRNPVVSEKY